MATSQVTGPVSAVHGGPQTAALPSQPAAVKSTPDLPASQPPSQQVINPV